MQLPHLETWGPGEAIQASRLTLLYECVKPLGEVSALSPSFPLGGLAFRAASMETRLEEKTGHSASYLTPTTAREHLAHRPPPRSRPSPAAASSQGLSRYSRKGDDADSWRPAAPAAARGLLRGPATAAAASHPALQARGPLPALRRVHVSAPPAPVRVRPSLLSLSSCVFAK